MSDSPSVQRIAELQQLIADFAKVERVVKLADNDRLENDAEHSYGLALTCWYLAPKIAPELNLGTILQYALAHDIVELHAGDTFIFAEQAELDSKESRERSAVAQIAKDWADFPELADFAAGYMDKRDEEAKFVKAVDKILPVLMVNLGEKDSFWHRHSVTLQMEVDNKVSLRVSEYMAPYYERLVEWMSDPNYFYQAEDTATNTA